MVGKAVVLLLLSALVAVGFARHEDRIREQDRLALIASDLAGRNVGVHCPSFFAKLVDVHGEAGRVQFDAAGRPADHTDLSPETCKELGRFSHVDFSCIDTSSCRYPEFQTAWAAHTLAHESFHLRGIQDEGVKSATRSRRPESSPSASVSVRSARAHLSAGSSSGAIRTSPRTTTPRGATTAAPST